MVCCVIRWQGFVHSRKSRAEKAQGSTIKPEYRLELQGVNAKELAYVVEEEFGKVLQDAGVEIVVVDNDRKAHSKTMRDAWAKFGIAVWPGAGIVGDRTLFLISLIKMKVNLVDFPLIRLIAWCKIEVLIIL